MKLLVTRPKNDAGELIIALESSGHKSTHLALMDICFFDAVNINDQPLQAVLITSANGARGLGRHAKMPDLRSCLAVCVGSASAAAAKSVGFEKIALADRGDVNGLIDYVSENLDPGEGALLYASGSKTTGDLESVLGARGYQVNRVILYKAERLVSLRPDMMATLQSGGLDGVILYSPRTAKIWISVTKGCISPGKLANLRYYCLSQNVAKIISRELGENCDVTICKTPDTAAMVDAINQS